jgi:Protein of unknown function (DUF3096)
MHLTVVHSLLPIASLAAGIFLLIAPRVVSFVVAVYLIFVGLVGLNGIYHIVKEGQGRGTEAPCLHCQAEASVPARPEAARRPTRTGAEGEKR